MSEHKSPMSRSLISYEIKFSCCDYPEKQLAEVMTIRSETKVPTHIGSPLYVRLAIHGHEAAEPPHNVAGEKRERERLNGSYRESVSVL